MSEQSDRPLRIGVLGAARISADAIVGPAQRAGARLVAVAARDRSRADAFAREHGFERAYGDYAEVLDDPEVEVVYNPLVNPLHGPWNLRAVAAGKPVLSEKPFAANAAEATTVRDASVAAGVPVIEAFHHAHHPLMARMRELSTSGEIGELRYVEARMLMAAPDPSDPRWSAELAGGGLMDVGCYAVQTIRDVAALLGGEPTVQSARAGELAELPGVDAWLTGELTLPGGIPARLESSMSHQGTDSSLRLVGSDGEAYAPNFIKPHRDDRIIVSIVTGRRTDRRTEHLGSRSTFDYQLDALTALVRDGVAIRTNADQAVHNMQLIDDLYRAAGMDPRTAGTAA